MLENLSASEQEALDKFKNFLLTNYSDRIELLKLFGSKARGSSEEDSDIDILLVVDTEDRKFDNEIYDLMSELSINYGALISPVVFMRGEFEFYKKARSPIIKNIEREGITIWEKNSEGQSKI